VATQGGRAVPAEVLRTIKEVEIRARILADEGWIGAYRSVFRGSGLDFEEVREYTPGDEIRSIDWNVTARMGFPYVKKFREERKLNVVLAVDLSASSWFGTVRQSKRELAAEVAALLAVTAMRANDNVSLLLFSDAVHTFIPPREGREHLLRVIYELLFAEPRRARTDIAAAARYLGNVLKKRSVVFLLSDFIDSGFEGPLRMLGRRHDVIAVALTDPRERELPDVGRLVLEDAETGRLAEIDTSSAALREAYAYAARARRLERLRGFARMAIDSVDVATDRPYVPPLLALFNARTARRH
jgi:uncharacterized protein (DUF58 family)